MKLKFIIIFLLYITPIVKSKKKGKKQKEFTIVKNIEVKRAFKKIYSEKTDLTLEGENQNFSKQLIKWISKIKKINKTEEYIKFTTTYEELKGGNSNGEILRLRNIIQKRVKDGKEIEEKYIELIYGSGRVDFNTYIKPSKKIVCRPVLWLFEYCFEKKYNQQFEGNLTQIAIDDFQKKMMNVIEKNERKENIRRQKEEKKKKLEEKKNEKRRKKKKEKRRKKKNIRRK